MNKTKLKAYAPKARKDFIAAVTARANLLGLSDNNGKLEVAVGERKGDIAIIAGREWPVKVYSQREHLIKRMTNEGFSHTVEAVAYTWFNRFAALRYMEIHDYLDHGHRVLSNRAGGMPEILNHATELDLPALNKAKAIELKLAGNKDNDLYKLILVAQCNALSSAMPFLFERIDDETELLLPDNLLLTDSVIAKLVADIPEEDWQEVEIIGWLYQFYISEKKDQVIGKVVKSEDIPAATQLFTPNWIVQYLVQNSVGRLWLMANPQSTLAKEWPYYITPAEQTPEVQAQLDALIQTRVREDGDTLNPESITVLDPACGSGHILVVAYDVLKAIYLERGYQARAIPRLILEKNLFGLDIDDRAAQMAGFALLMKARADDRRLFNEPIQLKVLALQESKGLDADVLTRALQSVAVVGQVHPKGYESPEGVTRQPNGEFGDSDLFPGTRPQMNLGESVMSETSGYAALTRPTVAALIATFEHAKTFGSLIQIPYALKTHLAVLPQVLALVKQSGDMYASAAADDLLPLVQQAQLLAMQFDAVVANPPYMGNKYLNVVLKNYINEVYQNFESDLFASFISRSSEFAKLSGFIGIMSPHVWMYISTHRKVRNHINQLKTLNNLLELPLAGFKGATVQICAFNFLNNSIDNYRASFIRLVGHEGAADDFAKYTIESINNRSCDWYYVCSPRNLGKITGEPISYWISDNLLNNFIVNKSLDDVAFVKKGIDTGDNARFLRFWWEININYSSIFHGYKKWFPYIKGGEVKKWYGNLELLVNWEFDGQEIKEHKSSTIRNKTFFFKSAITWTLISSKSFSARAVPIGCLFDNNGSSVFPKDEDADHIILLMNSKVASNLLGVLNPTAAFQVGDISRLPLIRFDSKKLGVSLIDISKFNWDSYETSWDFTVNPVIRTNETSLTGGYIAWQAANLATVAEMKRLEEENNRLFIEAYALHEELTSDVSDEQITLTRADREKDSQRLISFAIGCMMGRYSLDEPGLIYAHAGNVGFEPGRYTTFPADADGIVPTTDESWFADDAPSRIREFLRAVWGQGTLEENMAWLAESLGTKATETPDETIRRYIADKFFKDHLQTYKKRPIYWLFSSGKQGAFQALVYLHRYNESTLARMRSEYVVPLTGKMLSRIEMLLKDAESAAATAVRTKISKEIEVLRKQHLELLAYDEKLRHYADMRIQLDLDDGVKVNYGRFGDLLAEVKAVTGGTGDD